MTRRFEFVGGNSAKFWEASVNGVQVTVHYGRLDTNGQTQTKTFDTGAAAIKHAQQLIAQKIKKGYMEVAVA